MMIHVSHGARGGEEVDGGVTWFVVLPLTGLGHDGAVGSLLDAGRTVYELDVAPWQDKLIAVNPA